MIDILVTAVKTVAQSSVSRQKAVMFIAKSNQQDLTLLGELITTGKLRPVIDRTCKLDETPESLAYLEKGHARGKVVIAVAG
jgi:NADPH:quinone reductase-like Zn-dependent oxidoreductase